MQDGELRLDHIDHALIRMLQADGRKSYAEMAQEVGVAENTVRNRVNRMMQAGVFRIVAVTDPFKTGFRVRAMVGIRVAPGHARRVVEWLKKAPNAFYVAVATGEFDIIVEGIFPEQRDLLTFLTETLPAVGDIRETRTWFILDLAKSTYEWGTVEES